MLLNIIRVCDEIIHSCTNYILTKDKSQNTSTFLDSLQSLAYLCIAFSFMYLQDAGREAHIYTKAFTWRFVLDGLKLRKLQE